MLTHPDLPHIWMCVICVMKTKVFKLILIRIDLLTAYYKYLVEDFYFDP